MPRLFLLNEPLSPRLSPALAHEIGLNESILLLQIEVWLDAHPQKIDGTFWTRVTRKQVDKTLPFWNKTILNKVIRNLTGMDLIEYDYIRKESAHYFTINEEACRELDSIRVIRIKSSGVLKNTKKEIYSISLKNGHDFTDIYDELDAMAHAEAPTREEETPKVIKPQPLLFHKPDPKPKAQGQIIPTMHKIMYRICYSIETDQQSALLGSAQRGKVASALGKLNEGHADLNRLVDFEKWWKTFWKSGGSGVYQPPRPEQVVEHWWVAMKATQQATVAEETNVVDMDQAMLDRARLRRNGGQQS